MTVGILTFHFANNFGAVLQAHGLCRTIERLGHTARIIDYVPPGKLLPWWKGWGLRSGGELPARALSRFRFDRFRRRWFSTTRPCRTHEELRAVAREFDAVVVGSDQVWNGNGGAYDPAYFLPWDNATPVRKISYAACFGDATQPEATLQTAGPWLRRFDHLSARNRMSARLVRELSGRTAETVADPTLLHSYDELSGGEGETREYIAAYYLPRDGMESGIEVLRQVRERTGLPAIPMSAGQPILEGEYAGACQGPGEWLRRLRGARFVCTNSFHGAVFAVKFRKPFLVWSPPASGGFRGPARIEDFLERCGLEDRLVARPDPDAIDRLLETPIDYRAVSERLEPHIEASRRFLAESLSPSRFRELEAPPGAAVGAGDRS